MHPPVNMLLSVLPATIDVHAFYCTCIRVGPLSGLGINTHDVGGYGPNFPKRITRPPGLPPDACRTLINIPLCCL